jgi:hypothetical protein
MTLADPKFRQCDRSPRPLALTSRRRDLLGGSAGLAANGSRRAPATARLIGLREEWSRLASVGPKLGRARIMPSNAPDLSHFRVPPTDTEMLIQTVIAERLAELHAELDAQLTESMPAYVSTMLCRLAASNLMDIELQRSWMRDVPAIAVNAPASMRGCRSDRSACPSPPRRRKVRGAA